MKSNKERMGKGSGKKEAKQSETKRKEGKEKEKLVVLKNIDILCYDCDNIKTVFEIDHIDRQRKEQATTTVLLDLSKDFEYNVCINTSSETIVLEKICSYDVVKKCDHIGIGSISKIVLTK